MLKGYIPLIVSGTVSLAAVIALVALIEPEMLATATKSVQPVKTVESGSDSTLVAAADSVEAIADGIQPDSTVQAAMDSTEQPLARIEEKFIRPERQIDSLSLQEQKNMAKIFEAMEAESAARILYNMDDRAVKQILVTMKKRQSAKILAVLEPKQAARILKGN